MDVFIKSFNRPFYLDRCLGSIECFVSGEYSVSVLDDGTPQKYLDKIQEKYPFVKIKKSKNHQDKEKAIQENLAHGTEINGFQIPTDLWYSSAENASEYFIMIEDDVWFTEKINLDDLQKSVKENNVNLLKLGWLGNFSDDKWANISSIDENLVATQPKDLFLANSMIMDWFMYNKFKFFTILFKLGMVDNFTKLKYWHLNSILMGFWKKEYWLYIWKEAKGKVDEKQQLRNASVFYKNYQKNPNFIARMNKEVLKTTFQSSATNSYHQYGFAFDVNYFNHLINEAWLKDNFDAMQGFPKDFSLDYFENFLDEKINKEAFRQWVEQFKNQYKNLGCNVE